MRRGKVLTLEEALDDFLRSSTGSPPPQRLKTPRSSGRVVTLDEAADDYLGHTGGDFHNQDIPDHLLRDTNIEREIPAAPTAPLGMLPELDHIAYVRNRRRAREVYERKIIPGTKKSVLGQIQKIFGGGPLLPCVYYVAETDDEAIPITIVTVPPPVTVRSAIRPFVRVQWGTRSTVVQTDVDVGVGNEFTVMGSSVLVSVGADSVFGSANPTFVTGAMAGFGVWSGTSPVFRTHFYDFLAPAAPRTQAVPSFAVSLYSLQRSVSTVPIEIQFNDAAGTVLYDFTLAASAFFQFPIPIADDVASITVTNNSIGTLVNARAMFQMAL